MTSLPDVYIVGTYEHNGYAVIEIHLPGLDGYKQRVDPPGWFDRMRGITYSQKVEREYRKMSNKCRKLNDRRRQAREALKSLGGLK